MAYIPDPTDSSQPVGSVKASTAAAEFRALKAYLNSVVAGGLPPSAGLEGSVLTVNEVGAASWRYTPNLFNFFAMR
jgi:hypothetical protein